MRLARILALMILLAGALGSICSAQAQLLVSVHVNVEPPQLPVYDQPVIPGPGYIWVPGYWAWSDDVGGYYWVRGRGYCRRKSAYCGPRAIGAGAMVCMCFMPAIGDRKSVSMAA